VLVLCNNHFISRTVVLDHSLPNVLFIRPRPEVVDVVSVTLLVLYYSGLSYMSIIYQCPNYLNTNACMWSSLELRTDVYVVGVAVENTFGYSFTDWQDVVIPTVGNN
jgi:hypothetical protein